LPGATTKVTIEAPAKLVYEVITDFSSYPEFLDETREVEVIKKTAKSAQVEFVIRIIKRIRYVLDYKLTPDKQITWTLAEGDAFKLCNGSWKLKEKEEGVTDATYQVEVDFGLFVPKKITEMLVGKNLPGLMQAFKERTESLL